MATVQEISNRYNIRLKKLRRMKKDGVLTTDPDSCFEDSNLDELRRYARSRGGFTAAHLVSLIEEPGLLDSLGCHADKARRQLAELGAPEADAAPTEVWAEICVAVANEVEAVTNIVKWCKSVIPPDREVKHHYLAVRLLLGVPNNIRHWEVRRIQRVMLNCRKHKEFAGWWHVDTCGKRKVTFYHRPKLEFDL